MLALGAVTLCALAACGGGTAADGTQGALDSGSDTARTTTFTGTVQDVASGQVVSGATVSVGVIDSATPVSTTTAADGSYRLSVGTSRLNTASTVVVSVVAGGYRPCLANVSDLNSAGGSRAVTECTSIGALPAGTFAPAEGAVITRLGDGAAGSATETNNARLSTLSAGTSKEIRIGAVNAATAGSNLGLSVRLKMRGLEATCANKVSIYQNAASPLLVASGGTGGSLVSSDIRGEFSAYEFRLPTASLPATGDLFLRVESGACGGSSSDGFDDFEFVDLTGTFTATAPF